MPSFVFTTTWEPGIFLAWKHQSFPVVKTKEGTLPDRTFEEAGNLAAFYSKGRTAPKVEIDYLQKKNVKKPAGAKPGFVVYYTNYSLMASPDIAGIQQLS